MEVLFTSPQVRCGVGSSSWKAIIHTIREPLVTNDLLFCPYLVAEALGGEGGGTDKHAIVLQVIDIVCRLWLTHSHIEAAVPDHKGHDSDSYLWICLSSPRFLTVKFFMLLLLVILKMNDCVLFLKMIYLTNVLPPSLHFLLFPPVYYVYHPFLHTVPPLQWRYCMSLVMCKYQG